jgi:hypothetical protein
VTSIAALTVLMIRSKRPASFLNVSGVACRVVCAGAESQAVVLLAQRLREDRHLRAHRVRDLHRHVAETAEADDGDLLARATW